MSDKASLERQLEAAFRGSEFHSFLGSLKRLTSRESLWAPPRYAGFAHQRGNILSLAFHTIGDKLVLMSHAFGDASVGWDQVKDRLADYGGGSSALLRLAEEAHEAVIDQLRAWPEDHLDEPRPYYGGKNFTARRIFEIVAEHDLYHAGQIRYIRCLIAGGAPSIDDR